MDSHWETVQGNIVAGYQVASGRAKDSPYPQGTIQMQTPYFQKLGLDITALFSGTLNVSIHPYTFCLKNPEYFFQQVKWSLNHAAEDFSFSRCYLTYRQCQYASLIYYPHPETKLRHFQDTSTLEILAPPIPQIQSGDRVAVTINIREIELAVSKRSH